MFALDSDARRLSELAREGAWVKLGSPTGERTLRDFIREARPRYVFYMAGANEQEIIAGNEQAVIRQNVIAPLNALRYAESARALSFIYVTDTLDETGSARLFKCGEEALMRSDSETLSVAAVNVEGLIREGGLLSRMQQKARAGQKLTARAGEEKAFISCRSAAAALISMAQTRCEGRFTIKGEISCDMADVARAVTRMALSRAEAEIIEDPEPREESGLRETGLEYIFRRGDEKTDVPECVFNIPPQCPDQETCARILES